jgi:D-3-phosphoglycerate dehydrogenase / 2-oxoglutarate reductase
VRVIVTDHVFADLDLERAAIEELGGEVELAPAADEETLVEAAARADALLVCFARVGPRVIEAAAGNGCKVISRYGIGVDNIDVAAATRFGIRVTNVPDYCIEEVADHTIALVLLSARQLLAGIDSVRSGGWEMPHGRVHRVAGQRLALLGVGRIGARVLERALPLGLDVVGYDPFLRAELPGLRRAASAEEAVADADFISLHAPLTPETRHLVGELLISKMRRAPYVVNTSRGGLVDAEAALRALDAGTLSGLALDVTEDEPLAPNSPLRSHPNVIVTPHMAFYSVEAERVLQQRAVDEVVRALQGRPAVSTVN